MNRQMLKAVNNFVRFSREYISKIDPDNKGPMNLDLAKLENGLIDAETAVLNLLESTMIRREGMEPLTNEEEDIYDGLQSILRIGKKEFDELTFEQKFSAARVIVKQGGVKEIRHPVATPGDYLGISFRCIFIGIEKDGYAHS